MGQLADRIAFLTTRYGSDAAAWQHEIHALAALETQDAKAALDRFHALKRRLAEFRRAQLLRELRAFPFVADVPTSDTQGFPLKEIESDIRDATRALAHAKRVERALREIEEARRSVTRRALPAPPAPRSTRWTELAHLAEGTEALRRAALREAKLDERLRKATARARKLDLAELPDATLPADALDAALDAIEAQLERAQEIADAHADAVAPLHAPEVTTYRHETRRRLEREAAALRETGDVRALHALATRTRALREEAAALASQAARSRRKGLAAPERERRPGDGIDPYG